MSKNLIINLSFNCPEISIMGPIKESTIDRLNEVLPSATNSTRSVRGETPQFQFLSNPDHWYIKLEGQFCDTTGVSRLMVILLNALEEEGDWTLVSSQAANERSSGAIQQEFVEHYKLVFVKFAGDE
eukprot:gene4523-3310_t